MDRPAKLSQVSYSDQQGNRLVISDKYFEQQFTGVREAYYQETRMLNQEDFDPYQQLIQTGMTGQFFRPTELFQQKLERSDTAIPFTI